MILLTQYTLLFASVLLLVALGGCFSERSGVINIGVAGQYVAGACAALYFGLALRMPWWVCMIAAMLSGALLGALSGALKTYRNVNVVISGIMLNWIALYVTNMILSMDGL